MTPTEIYNFVKDIYVATKHNNFQSVVDRLKAVTRENRGKIVNTLFYGHSVLCLASLKGLEDLVNYYVEECGADLEQTGIYDVREDLTTHVVTPLWIAAVSGHLGVVKTLIQHGADVNKASDTKSTPVRSACYLSRIEIVRYLIECGADISVCNVYGGTCLMNSIQSEELCRLLLDHGANLDAQDQGGNTALHYAIKESRLGSVKLLVEAGSNVFIGNESNDDALQTAALRGNREILEYLMAKTKPSKKRVIDCYEIMGTNFIDEKHDLVRGREIWKEALRLRQTEPIVPKPENPAIQEHFECKEFQTVAELDAAAHDPDRMYLQSIMIRERILGPDHKDTLIGLLYRGAVYADSRCFKECIAVWTYALRKRHRQKELSHDTVNINMHSLAKLFCELWRNASASFKPSFHHVFTVLEIMVSQLHYGKDTVVPPPKMDLLQRDYVKITLLLITHLVNLVNEMTLDHEERYEFKKLVHKLIRINARTYLGRDLLHLVCDHRSVMVEQEFFSVLANEELVALLVECGVDVNSLDNDGNNALHILASSMRLDRAKFSLYKPLALYLLEVGAHFDAKNHTGFVAFERLKNSGCSVNIGKFIQLKCLAARSIVENNVSFEGEVPVSLESFIKIHGETEIESDCEQSEAESE